MSHSVPTRLEYSSRASPCKCACHCSKHAKSGSCARNATMTEAVNTTNTDKEQSKNPFRKSDDSPDRHPAATAYFSKSFLHVKHMVRNMRARWESFADDEGDEGECVCYNRPAPPRKYGDMAKIGGTLHGEIGSKTPRTTAAYTLEPLQPNPEDAQMKQKPNRRSDDKTPESFKNLSTMRPRNNIFEALRDERHKMSGESSKPRNHAFSATASNKSADRKKPTGIVQPLNNISQLPRLHPSNPFLPDLQQTQKSGKKTYTTHATIEVDDSRPTRPVQTPGTARVNDFWPTEEVQWMPADDENLNESDDSTVDPSSHPHSIQSQVTTIRNSFETEVCNLVEKVKKTPFDWKRSESPNSLHQSKSFDDELLFDEERITGRLADGPNSDPGFAIVGENRRTSPVTEINIPVPPVPRPHSIQSQVETVRHSFDTEVSNIVKIVERTLIDQKPSSASHNEVHEPKSSGDELLLEQEQEKVSGRLAEGPSTFKFDTTVDKSQNAKVFDTLVTAIKTNGDAAPPVSPTSPRFRTEVTLTLQNNVEHSSKDSLDYRANLRKHSHSNPHKRSSAPHESSEGLMAVAIHYPTTVLHQNLTKDTEKMNKCKRKDDQIRTYKRRSSDEDDGTPLEEKESTYIAYISIFGDDDDDDKDDCDKYNNVGDISSSQSLPNVYPHQGEHDNPLRPETVIKRESSIDLRAAETRSSIALGMDGRGIRRAVLEDGELLSQLSQEFDNVFATPSNVQVEPIARSVSVTNTHLTGGNESGRTSKGRNSRDDKRKSDLPGLSSMYRQKQFHICHKCHKIVESGEAAFHFFSGHDTAWHRNCFVCHVCQQLLSEGDHGFFDYKPYCMEHYASVADVPKCFKCHKLIYDSTYTSAAGHFWHRDHFTCHSCKKPLMDTRYIVAQGRTPYCFHCHETTFPKVCRACQARISPQEPYVQSGDAFWHSNDACLQCSTCKRSLVGRSLLFRKDGHLYCNRYCAVREI